MDAYSAWNCDPRKLEAKFSLTLHSRITLHMLLCRNTVCPTHFRTRHFFNNFITNEDIATKFEADLPHCVRNVTTS